MLEQSSRNWLWDTCGNTITIAQNQAVVFVKLLNSRLLVSVVCWRLGELLFMYMHDVAYTRLLHFFFFFVQGFSVMLRFSALFLL